MSLSALSELVYSPLKEEQQFTGWSKSTIDYITTYKGKVEKSIRGIAKSLGKTLQKADVDDIYGEIEIYLYKSDDYNIVKASEKFDTTGVVVSLEGYIHSCIKYCVKRYVSSYYNTEKNIVRDHVKDDNGKELSLFDTITDYKDDNIENCGYQLDTICKFYESQRYSFGADIFLVWFVRLQTTLCNKKDHFLDVLEILGVSKKDIAIINKGTCVDSAMESLARAISMVKTEDAIEVLRNYTYSADKIQEVIELF